MEEKVVKRYKLKPWVRISILLIFLFNVSLSAYYIHMGRHPKGVTQVDYKYSVDEKLDYTVHLKDNDFYEEDFLGEGKQYATELIDYVTINFNYEYSGSMPTDNEITYEINGTIIGGYEDKNNGNAELWKKNYVLLDEVKDTKESASFNVNKTLKIDYHKYSKVVDNFKSNFKIAIDAYLDVVLKVKYNVKLDDNTITTNTDIMEVQIPLSKTTINITKNFNDHRYTDLGANPIQKDNKLIRKGVALNLVSLAVFLLLSPHVFISNKTYYEKTLDKIMKTYAEIIAEVDSPPSTEGLQVIDVKNFDDMVDIEEEIKSPILYYEIKEKTASLFAIITDGYIYRYMLTK